MRSHVLPESPRKNTVGKYYNPKVDLNQANRYSIETLKSYAQSQNIKIPENSTKQDYIDAIFSNNTNKKSISFSIDSPKRFRMPEYFKNPPSPFKFKDENTGAEPHLSPILVHKRAKVSSPSLHPMLQTPSASFRNAFHEKPNDTISPAINSLAGSMKRHSRSSHKYEKTDNNLFQTCDFLPLFVSFFVSGSVVTFALLSLL
ncbi:hypothetical protein TRFO_08192 [Tritrichomonas foetus]|uniref:HeH/LEM domain-containing protein n=1 Tax=Tritrichomonas foetus TaxID=1144522 RepID=A0A1J4JN77_9EUKA|nr:hypothetical protein TRFO_08192 [Tritrichomonas foetus]|eukprot:OHS99887.1 hypothetical protein TRFO_08192 [Tritrichomonas foetus]